MKMFKAMFYYTPKIEEIEVSGRTQKSVMLESRRENIRTEGHQWCNTRDEAKNACIGVMEGRVWAAQKNLEFANELLRAAKTL